MRTYKSDIKQAIHEGVSDLYEIGLVDKDTMRRFDESCLTPVEPITPEEIKRIRDREHASQAVFARHLNVTTGLVSKWERGEKKPSGPALKLLALAKAKGLEAIR